MTYKSSRLTILFGACLSIGLFFGMLSAQAATLGEIDVTKSPYSADATGAADATSAFQSALNAAGQNGAVVRVPAGQYLFGGTLNVPAQVVLEGVNDGERSGSPGGGTRFLVTAGSGSVGDPGKADDTPFLTLNANSSVRNVNFFYPGQADPSHINNWTPTPFPFTISMVGRSGSVENVNGVNPYQFIEAASPTGQSQRENIRRVLGTPLVTGIYIDNDGDGSGNSSDCLEDIHFVCNWGNGPCVTQIQNHATAFQINHADEIVLRSCFCFTYEYGYHFGISPLGGSASGTIVNCDADTSLVAVQIDNVQSAFGGLVFEGGGYSAIAPGPCVNIANTNTGSVTFNGTHYWGPYSGFLYDSNTGKYDISSLADGEMVHNASAGGVTTFLGCDFVDWGKLDNNYSSVLSASSTCIVCGDPSNPGTPSGKTRIVHCHFKRDQYHYTYTPGEAGVLFEGNNVPHGVRSQVSAGTPSPSPAGPKYLQANNF